MEQIKIIELTAIPHRHTLTRVCICQKKTQNHVDAEDLKLSDKYTNLCSFLTFNAFANLLLHVSMKLQINRINLKQ